MRFLRGRTLRQTHVPAGSVAPPRTDPIIVLGLMRSGTTFVQRVLNCHPDITIWGEHGGALQPLLVGLEPVQFDEHHRERIATGYSRREAVIGPLSDAAAFDPYVSPVPPEAYERLVDEVLRRHLAETFTTGLAEGVRWGFKETRYAGTAFRSLARVFPDAHFVFVTRSIRSWMSSVVRAPFRDDLAPEDLDSTDKVQQALDELSRLWIQRTAASVRFIEERPDVRVLVTQERLHSSDAVARLATRLEISPIPDPPLSEVLHHRAGSSDISREWTADARGRLESLISQAVEGMRDVTELDERIESLRLV